MSLVGVFGGSFNPPHIAHVLAAALVRAWAEVDQVLVVPVYRHPFAKELVAFEHRLAMCELAFESLVGVSVSDVERQLGGESLTLRTLEHLVADRPDDRFRLLIGSDVLPDLHKWHRFERIRQLAPPLVFDRAGATEDGSRVMLPSVSSSEIRRLIAEQRETELARLMPGRVKDYVQAHQLYRPGLGSA